MLVERLKYLGKQPDELQFKWRTQPPEVFDSYEAMTAILDALITQGCVAAWSGDGTSCVEQMLGCLHSLWRNAEDRLAINKAITEKDWKKATEVYLKSAGPGPDGKFQFELQNTLIPLIAEHLVATFKGLEGENYVEMEFDHEELGPFYMTIQKKWGKTPGKIAAEQRELAKTAETKLTETRNKAFEEAANALDKLASDHLGAGKIDYHVEIAEIYEHAASRIRSLNRSSMSGTQQPNEHESGK